MTEQRQGQRTMSKSSQAFRTIREVADWLGVAAHVLRFWESKFSQIKPVKRAGGRRYYRPADMELVGGIKVLLHDRGMTIRGVQKMIREEGIASISALSPPLDALFEDEIIDAGSAEDWARDAASDAQVDTGISNRPDVDEATSDHAQAPLPLDEPDDAVPAEAFGAPEEATASIPQPMAATLVRFRDLSTAAQENELALDAISRHTSQLRALVEKMRASAGS
jgi:DNA-binding transcriptional MerR regulator